MGGWVGGWEKEGRTAVPLIVSLAATTTPYIHKRVSGWVGGWVGEGRTYRLAADRVLSRNHHPIRSVA